MKVRHRFVACVLGVGTVILGALPPDLTRVGSLHAQPASQEAPDTTKVELLFVQNAVSGSYDGKRLTLVGVGPTVFFSDRPYRTAGQVHTQAFITHWDKGSDNFAQNPPNATLSIFNDQGVDSVV